MAATHRIAKELTQMGYVVNRMTPEKEAALGLSVAMPAPFSERAFVVDIGSGGTEISWVADGKTQSVSTFGSKYYEYGATDDVVAADVKAKAQQVPAKLRQTCFIIGGVPYEMAKQVRQGKERYTVLDVPSAYQFDKAKTKAGLVIYRSLAEATGCKQFVFDWDANFTIGYLLSLPPQ
jgi:exopolyphosphatase/pppGpp-phosphohydrolase